MFFVKLGAEPVDLQLFSLMASVSLDSLWQRKGFKTASRSVFDTLESSSKNLDFWSSGLVSSSLFWATGIWTVYEVIAFFDWRLHWPCLIDSGFILEPCWLPPFTLFVPAPDDGMFLVHAAASFSWKSFDRYYGTLDTVRRWWLNSSDHNSWSAFETMSFKVKLYTELIRPN